MITPHTIHKFFTISNLIEGIDDNDETLSQIDLLEDLSVWNDKEAMLAFHTQMKHLNSYCAPWKLRNYSVSVWGRKCLDYNLIPKALDKLLLDYPETKREIQEWHIKFEHIHPFGDWNGRVGRFLMLRHYLNNWHPIPQMFLSRKNFEENRRKYYLWF